MPPARRPVEQRFWEKVNKNGPLPATRPDLGSCWLWTAKPSAGYGYINLGGAHGKYTRAHRFAYELLVGPIPDGLVLDHLCVNTLCVNPTHLEPVTQAENMRRAGFFEDVRSRHESVTHCPEGHLYDEANTYYRSDRPSGGRHCRTCRRLRMRARRSQR